MLVISLLRGSPTTRSCRGSAGLVEPVKEIFMAWHIHLAHFFGGAFFANALPHLNAGICGRALQSPFSSPPFKGLSSPIVNIAWALANLAVAYLLLVQVAAADLRSWSDVGVCFAGFATMALQCSRSFTRINKQTAL
jgi:hypothetical protein